MLAGDVLEPILHQAICKHYADFFYISLPMPCTHLTKKVKINSIVFLW